MKAITKIFDGQPQRLEAVAVNKDRRIRRVNVLNNTPYFLYVGREQNVGRETALFVVEPYTDVTMPVDEAQNLYVLEGSPIGVIPQNSQANIYWDAEPCELAHRKTWRNTVIPIYQGEVGVAGVTTNMTAQGIGSETPVVFAVPASARRRTIYVIGASSGTVSLQGSADGENWVNVLSSDQMVTAIPDTLALPPYLRLKVSAPDGSTINAFMVVDL